MTTDRDHTISKFDGLNQKEKIEFINNNNWSPR